MRALRSILRQYYNHVKAFQQLHAVWGLLKILSQSFASTVNNLISTIFPLKTSRYIVYFFFVGYVSWRTILTLYRAISPLLNLLITLDTQRIILGSRAPSYHPKPKAENLRHFLHPSLRRGRSGQDSLPYSTPLQSRARTFPESPHMRRLPSRPEVGS